MEARSGQWSCQRVTINHRQQQRTYTRNISNNTLTSVSRPLLDVAMRSRKFTGRVLPNCKRKASCIRLQLNCHQYSTGAPSGVRVKSSQHSIVEISHDPPPPMQKTQRARAKPMGARPSAPCRRSLSRCLFSGSIQANARGFRDENDLMAQLARQAVYPFMRRT